MDVLDILKAMLLYGTWWEVLLGCLTIGMITAIVIVGAICSISEKYLDRK